MVSELDSRGIGRLASRSLMSPSFWPGFANNWEAFMGSRDDPADGQAVATTCYIAAMVYAGFIVFCGCQLAAAKRYSRIQL